MELRDYSIAWTAAGTRRSLRVEGAGAIDCNGLRARCDFDGELLAVRVEANAPIRIERCRVELARTFGRRDRVLVNGYQSWTETRELAPNARLRGLSSLPRAIVDRFVLDGSGDYRFHAYDGKPGHLHGWTYADVRRGGEHELVASTDETCGFTLIEVDTGAGAVALETEPPARELAAGERLTLCSCALLRGSEQQVYDRWFGIAGIRARAVSPLVGYSSWYRHYGDIDEGKLLHDLEGACRALAPLELGACRPLFQIDDGWCKVGDWLEPDASKFPNGLAPLARAIAEKGTAEKGTVPFSADGILPGLWLAPFVCERDSRLFHAHPDWLLRDARGRAVRTGSHWSGAYALDTLNPEVRAYVREVVRTASRDWGFRFLKLDFLYAACMLPHGGLNRGELMADAIQLLRDSAGEDTLLDGCGVPLASAFGRLDYCRVGCDVGLDWDGAPPLRLTECERVSTRNSLAATIARSPLDGRAFGSDPDVFFLRDGVRLSDARKRRLLEADATRASMLLSSDDMGTWDAEQLALFQRAIDQLSARKEGLT